MGHDKANEMVGAGILLICFLWIIGGCFEGDDGPRVVTPPDPNEKLAEVARESVQAAREAQAGEREARRDAAAIREASSTWHSIALVLAVGVPLTIVLLLFRFYANAPPDGAEMLAEFHLLMDDGNARSLPPGSPKPLPGPTEGVGSDASSKSK